MSSKDVLKLIKDKQIEFVDLRFTDPKGKLQHLTMDSTIVDEEMLDKGVFFDGSSIAGWSRCGAAGLLVFVVLFLVVAGVVTVSYVVASTLATHNRTNRREHGSRGTNQRRANRIEYHDGESPSYKGPEASYRTRSEL